MDFKMKRLVSTLLVLIMIFTSMLTLASCDMLGLGGTGDGQGSGSGNGNASVDFVVPEGGYDGSAVTVTFYHTMGAALREVLDAAIVRFNALYPNIIIQHEQTGSYDDVRDTIKTEIAVGAQPNMAYCYPDHVALYNLANAVVKLDSLIDSTITVTRDDGTTETLGLTAAQIADFIPGYYQEGAQFDAAGTMYTLPMSKSTEVLYYNKTFFDANGLKVPTTWAEMEQVCAAIKAIDPTSIPLGYDSESNWFITMCEQYGSDYTSTAAGQNFIFDNDTNYNFVKMFRDWYEKKYVTTQELNGGKYTSELFTATTGTKSYMSIGSSAGANHQRPEKVENEYPFEVGIATIPQVNPQNPQVISQGPSLCIFAKSNPQEVIATWLFTKFLATDVEFQAKFSMASGYVPVIKSVEQNSVYADFLAKADGKEFLTALSAKQCLAQADAYYTSPAFNGSSTARDQVGILMQNCFSQAPKAGESVLDMIKRLFADAIEECEYHHPQD